MNCDDWPQRLVNTLKTAGPGILELEEALLEAFEQAQAKNDIEAQVDLIQKIEDFYVLSEQIPKAEPFLLAQENLIDADIGKYLTASYYQWGLKDYAKALEKISEIEALSLDLDTQMVFDLLSVKGTSLAKLGRITNLEQVLNDQISLIRSGGNNLDFSSELALLEDLIEQRVFPDLCKEELVLINGRYSVESDKNQWQKLMSKLD